MRKLLVVLGLGLAVSTSFASTISDSIVSKAKCAEWASQMKAVADKGDQLVNSGLSVEQARSIVAPTIKAITDGIFPGLTPKQVVEECTPIM